MKENNTKKMSDFREYVFRVHSSLNFAMILIQFGSHVDRCHIKGSVSQIFDLGLNIFLCQKNGKLWGKIYHPIFYIS